MNHSLELDAGNAELLIAIDQLARHGDSGESYFAELLRLLIGTVGAASGHIWQESNGDFGPMVKSVAELEVQPSLYEQEQQLALEVYRDPAVRCEATLPNAASAHSVQRTGKTRFCLLSPLFDHQSCFAVASLIVYVADPYELELLTAVLETAAERVRKNFLFEQFASDSSQLSKTRKAQEVMLGISKHIDTKPLAFEVVNRLQKYLKSDRVSVAFKRNTKCLIKGISNQAVFDRRSSVVRRQEKLAERIAKIEEPLWYPSDEEVAPSLRKSLEKYFEVSNALSLAVLPIFGEPKRRDDPEDIALTIQADEERRECVGVLILEGLEEPLEREKIERRWSRIEQSVSNSITNARKYDGLFLMPLWRALGTGADFYRGHTRRKALLITSAILAAIAALFLIPADFKLRGEGEIQPVQRQHVYARTDGTVNKLHFVDGQQVAEGDALVDMKHPELATRIADVTGKLREAEKQLETVTFQRVTRAFESEQEERELVRSAATAEVRVQGLKEQFALLKQSESQLRVLCPMAGEVVSWDTQQRLSGRPVKRGDRLLTVALPAGKWEVELNIPDKRAGYLLDQWQQSQSDSDDMRVTFVLASDPTEVYEGAVLEVAPNSNIDEKEHENVVRVRIELTDEEFAKIDRVKPGTTVIGHVHCGRASIGYCKLYEFFDWSKRLWFKYVS